MGCGDDGEAVEGEAYLEGVGGVEVLTELMSGEEGDIGSSVEGVRGGEVGDLLVGEGRGAHEFHDVESGPRHIEPVQGAEVGELLEGDGLGVEVGGLDLAANVVCGFGDESGFGK